MARRYDRCGGHSAIVQHREVLDRALHREQQHGIKLRRGGVANNRAALDILLSADIPSWRRAH